MRTISYPDKTWTVLKAENGINYTATFAFETDSDEEFNRLIQSAEWEELIETQATTINNVPQQVDMRQARLALHAAGLLEGINQAILHMGEEAKIEWEYASTVLRTNPLIAIVQAAYGMTDEQIDNLFITASTL